MMPFRNNAAMNLRWSAFASLRQDRQAAATEPPNEQ